MSTEIDYYELLECQRGADDSTLKTSYRRLAMKYVELSRRYLDLGYGVKL